MQPCRAANGECFIGQGESEVFFVFFFFLFCDDGANAVAYSAIANGGPYAAEGLVERTSRRIRRPAKSPKNFPSGLVRDHIGVKRGSFENFAPGGVGRCSTETEDRGRHGYKGLSEEGSVENSSLWQDRHGAG